MKKKLALLTLSIIALIGCGGKKEKKPGMVVINVLDKDLYNDCHIKGSINVPFEDFESYIPKLSKNDQIVVYCSNYQCTASGEAVKMLKARGFENVWAYEAGMAEWHMQGLPVEGPCKESYLSRKTEKPEEEPKDVPVISTEELNKKMQ